MLSSIALIVAAVLPSQEPGSSTPALTWPTSAWPETTPREARVDADALAAIATELRGGRYGYVDSMLLIRDGRVFFD